VVLGVLALAAGVGGVFGIALPVFPILIVLCGVGMVAGALRRGDARSEG
jgi:hypothetical protein